jgi:hypothetical protein
MKRGTQSVTSLHMWYVFLNGSSRTQVHTWGPSSPLWAKFTPRGKLMLLKTVVCFFVKILFQHIFRFNAVERLNSDFANRVTRFGEFLLIGRKFTLGSFLNDSSSPKYFFPRKKFILTKKSVGTQIGRLFHKLNRSPCLQNAAPPPF